MLRAKSGASLARVVISRRRTMVMSGMTSVSRLSRIMPGTTTNENGSGKKDQRGGEGSSPRVHQCPTALSQV